MCRHVLSLIRLGVWLAVLTEKDVCGGSRELKKRNWKINGTNISKRMEKRRRRQRRRECQWPQQGWWLTDMSILGPWDLNPKSPGFKPQWCAAETPAGSLSMSLTWGCQWLVRLCLLELLLPFKIKIRVHYTQRVQGEESNEIEHSYWSRVFNWCQRL